MLKKFLLLLTALLIASAHAAEPSTPPPALNFPQAGFTIAAFDAPPGNTSAAVVSMAQPPEDNFSPNINVMIQPFTKTLKEFIVLSKTQFSQVGAIILSEKTPDDSKWVFEYQGTIQGKQLHFYAMAVFANNHIYLTTGTATESQWAKNADKIKKCVDSFKLNALSAQSGK